MKLDPVFTEISPVLIAILFLAAFAFAAMKVGNGDSANGAGASPCSQQVSQS